MSVEQAAERLRTYIGYDPIVRACSDYEPDDDCVKLADEYLRLFDPTPLSEEILRASGWEVPEWWEVSEGYSVYMRHQIAGGLFFEKHTGAYFEAFKGYVKTVGDLRRLLSALHIDCAVVVPESEATE